MAAGQDVPVAMERWRFRRCCRGAYRTSWGSRCRGEGETGVKGMVVCSNLFLNE